MGIFSDKEQEKINKKIDETLDEYFKLEEKLDIETVIPNKNDILYIIKKININDTLNHRFKYHFEKLINIYKIIKDKTIFYNLCNLYTKKHIIFNNNSIDLISSTYKEEKLIYEYFNILTNSNIINNEEVISIIHNYTKASRKYYLDDYAHFANISSFLSSDELKTYIINNNLYNDDENNLEELKNIINDVIKKDKKNNGIYDIDETSLAELQYQLDLIESASGELSSLIKNSNNTIKSLEEASKDYKKELLEAKKSYLKQLTASADERISSFETKYRELISEQRDTLATERETIFEEIESELSSKRRELIELYETVKVQLESQQKSIIRTADSSVQKLENMVINDQNIQQMINNAKSSKDFMDNIEKVTELLQTKKTEVVSSSNQPVVAIPGTTSIVTPIIATKKEREIDPTVNYFFDETIPFKQRYEKYLELKEKDIKENKTIYHEKFDDIIKLVILGHTPYLYGPSGCGKTHMIKYQIAKILNTDVTVNGYITYEQELLGYTNAGTGDYVESNLYRDYKYGGTICFDELDNGIANATVVLGGFIEQEKNLMPSYVFPNGERVMQHPNFRLITAGNTSGNGRTLAHNTRQKMDESLLQRLKPVFVNYDNRIEEQILNDYQDWFNFAIKFRKAIEDIPSSNGEEINTMGTFTTRDAVAIKEYLDNNVFTPEQIMEYEFIETKDQDTLSKISKHMNDSDIKEGKKLLKVFDKVIESKKRR